MTVSYGTFSCTLEGFDDSFDTMKAIAEYFRDLAADDRYFGAEPPTPDADMLARIAEKEIARRVEAHEDEGKIHLRAEGTPALAAAPAPQPAPAPASEPALEPAAEAVRPVEETAADESAEDTADTQEPATDQDADDAVAASIESAMADAADKETDAEVVQDAGEEAENAAFTEAEAEDDAEDQDIAPAPVAEAAAQDPEDDDSVAARLRRIRSVVARGDADFEPTGFSEDEHAQDFLGDTISDLDAALMADAPEAEDMPERVTSQVIDEDTHNDALEAISDQLTGDQDAEDDGFEDDAFENEAADIKNLAEDTLSQLLADAIPHDTDDEADESAALDGDIEEDDTAVSTPLRARVIKMKRSDFEAAIADGALEEAFDVLEDDAFDDEPAEAILSPEDEADLQSELDAVTAELEADAEPVSQDQDDLSDTYLAAEEDAFEDDFAEHAEDSAVETADDDTEFEEDVPAKSRLLSETDRPISRLFDETDSHLDTPEASRRRSAIQHLRAAVEANEAEADAGSELRRGADEGIYRSDIADVMRNNEAEDTVEAQQSEGTNVTRPRRPIETRPAPLKLVAEQRVDTDNGPVRPRRVSAASSAESVELPQDADSFSEFAEDIGANNLSELLEAAAAYMADVEGRVQFSRPMLMGKLKQATAQDFSREDSLKSFGQLLRNGKLKKLKGGRFTVTDETDFRAAKRDAS
ncbi:MAG: hypothetical protein AAF382_00545 [Pseudomonadota bacterium]